ncbi:hypothetical protein AGJ24_11525 [Cronobacter sakazakii]|nr:hypothetical protein [Cronobacter sakazakii]RWT63106.1 hypothetical protein DN588_06650 [Enterobacter cloacae]EGT5753871.1 hypothetical protein [Cronobacter sakazakii]EGZ6858504.1 hypothetical protein [Cronobacter sakazakii]EGZ6867436.1 hypothetical protein [Cronobacter sakazakii]
MDRKIFSVLFFYKRYRQPAPPLGLCVKTQNEKIEKNFTFFQFQGSEKDLTKSTSARNIKKKSILRHLGRIESGGHDQQ